MAPLILLQDMELLDSAYTHVTQGDIFNKSPFHVNYNATTGVVTTGFNFRAVWRFLWGYKTFGESKNLLKLIHRFLPQNRYDSLIDRYRTHQQVLAVAVTNTTTGKIKLVYDSTFGHNDYEQLCNWIWASANEPLYMSYVTIADTSYVDGGVREVIPIQQGIDYAINHDIDTIDVVINNSAIPIDQHWSIKGGGLLHGLERLLNIYDLGIVKYNEDYAKLLKDYYNAVGTLPPGERAAVAKRVLTVNFYCMPDEVAAKYPNELGFIQPAMLALLQAGLQYGANGQNCFQLQMDKDAIRAHPEMLKP
jgi:hypothetical protein